MAKVLHASYSGYFPFCIEESDDVGDPNGFYPIPMELEDIMEIFWKIKSFNGQGPQGEIPEGRIEYQKQDFGFVIAESEAGIVCAKRGIGIFSANFEIFALFCFPSGNIAGEPFVTKGVRKSGDSYYPSIYVQAIAAGPGGQNNEGFSTKFAAPNFLILNGSLNFFGHSLPLYGFSPEFGFLPYNGSLFASEYWPYQDD